ncbi:hypothetical protein ACVNIS_24890 (plasmid) [Sphaerotilaceae bacterium SBD11-9]
MTTTERLALYETAQETLGMLIAARSRLIGAERQKPAPDSKLIAKLQAEQNRFAELEDTLSLGDEATIKKVLADYGPIVRAAAAAA